MRTLFIVRGLPGSGKTTMAYALARGLLTYPPCEADQYFINDEGDYVFKPELLGLAHKECQRRIEEILAQGQFPAIVSNTFTTMKEMVPYLRLAEKYGYKVQVIECKGNFGSIHNVPAATLLSMQARWQEFNLRNYDEMAS